MRISLLVLALILSLVPPLADQGRAGCPAGDLNDDCQVNLQDVHILAEQWLVPPESSADLNGDDEVGVADLALLAKNWNRAGIPLVINELLASNSAIPDPQGEYDDWIEIYNAGSEAIDVGGMYLTDDLDDPTVWQIPDDNPFATTVPPDGYLLIWADNDTTEAGLHANFKLNAAGDQVGLFDADAGTLIDAITFGDQATGISYGHFPNASGNLRFMAFPTPGGENIGIYLGFVTDLTRLSQQPAHHLPPTTLPLTMTCGAP